MKDTKEFLELNDKELEQVSGGRGEMIIVCTLKAGEQPCSYIDNPSACPTISSCPMFPHNTDTFINPSPCAKDK